MYCLDFENQCAAVEYQHQENITGVIVSKLSLANHSYVILDTQGSSFDTSVSLNTWELENLVSLKHFSVVKLPKTNKSLPSHLEEQSWEAFTQEAVSLFHQDSLDNFRHLIKRLKTKKVGETSLIDIENVSLSVADYHRFLFQLEMVADSLPETLSPLADRTMLASNIISNLQGGISILAGASVEQHLQFALLLNDLEYWR
ncbi:hypothetical protein [Grimontia sp. SpTr1]|uniref:hypothetical protein n=1 Tax=Grimontia sp. SpTr1 TaxID=2995319 RepID=UPI00248BDFF2|nr:hypothetical protein [Grimontia sp. SpTr1]